MTRGGLVAVRIAGVVCRFKVDQADFEGWGIFKAISASTAQLIRTARLAERRKYLDLFPILRLIICCRARADWLAIPAHQADKRFQVEGMIPVRLIEDAQLFEVVQARFDGAQAWYDGPEPRHDPGSSSYLREALAAMVAPGELSRPGLTAEERSAYAANYIPRLQVQIEAARDRVEEKIRAALVHAGARYRDYQERGDVYRVTYEVDGCRHTTIVDRQDLSVRAAGICLSGEDDRFDLQSLVGVLREGTDTGQIVTVGLEDVGGRQRRTETRALAVCGPGARCLRQSRSCFLRGGPESHSTSGPSCLGLCDRHSAILDDRSDGVPIPAVETFPRGVIIGVEGDGQQVPS